MQPSAAPVMRNQRLPKMSASRPLMVTITAATRFHLMVFLNVRFLRDEMRKGEGREGGETNEIVIQM